MSVHTAKSAKHTPTAEAKALRKKDVTVTVGSETIECSAMIDGELIRQRYSGYTKREALEAFVMDVHDGELTTG